MASINRDKLIPYLEAYKRYLDAQMQDENSRPLSNMEENYKRDIAVKAKEILDLNSWTESEIGEGKIGGNAIKAVQSNLNLVGRYQVTSFSNKVKENYYTSERILYDFYFCRKDQECFEQICRMFGRKYDLVSYLYFVFDPNRYLPLRSSIFDRIFKNLGIDLQTSGRCSWENYQEFLVVVEAVRDVMKAYYKMAEIDLLDAHSFLWTTNLNVLDIREQESNLGESMVNEKKSVVGAIVFHKDYGKGVISKLTEKKVYVDFACGTRIFSYPHAFEKKYLVL